MMPLHLDVLGIQNNWATRHDREVIVFKTQKNQSGSKEHFTRDTSG